jgi:hypothetical protein
MQPIKHQLINSAASQNFIKQYQGNIYKSLLYGNFIDYYGCNDIEKSLYGYLMDRFSNWNADKFKVYESKNSFGI